MFTKLMYWLVEQITKWHTYFLSLNDNKSYGLTDKELHFIVIGLIGLIMIFIVYPIFKALAKHNHIMVVAWIYVFTCMIVLTFAIEIGQGITHTGSVEMEDVVAGLAGFIFFFAIFSCVRLIYHLILWLMHKED
ncbi:MAG: hypothetical protein PUA69_06930 [Erysipelotrichaceae bacterium]|nr:hypothetical protein [Erysipelotrichaceae bacterium]